MGSFSIPEPGTAPALGGYAELLAAFSHVSLAHLIKVRGL